MAELIFFASLREDLGCDKLILELPDDTTVATLISLLGNTRGESWRQALSAENIRVAVNQELIPGSVPVSNDDEIAFFPPVTGG